MIRMMNKVYLFKLILHTVLYNLEEGSYVLHVHYCSHYCSHYCPFNFHFSHTIFFPRAFFLQALACNRELLIKIKALERKCLDAEYSNRELEHRSILIERKLKVFDTFFGQQDIPLGLTARSAPTNPHSPAYAPIGLTRRSSAGKLDELGDWKSDMRYSGQLTPGIAGTVCSLDFLLQFFSRIFR